MLFKDWYITFFLIKKQLLHVRTFSEYIDNATNVLLVDALRKNVTAIHFQRF